VINWELEGFADSLYYRQACLYILLCKSISEACFAEAEIRQFKIRYWPSTSRRAQYPPNSF